MTFPFPGGVAVSAEAGKPEPKNIAIRIKKRVLDMVGRSAEMREY
jgi:hypothetical protein